MYLDQIDFKVRERGGKKPKTKAGAGPYLGSMETRFPEVGEFCWAVDAENPLLATPSSPGSSPILLGLVS